MHPRLRPGYVLPVHPDELRRIVRHDPDSCPWPLSNNWS
jgi:hypothetical protein